MKNTVIPLLATMFLLVGCAELTPTQRIPAQTTVARVYHEHIALSGRFSIQYRKEGKDESAHGGFEWIQDGDKTQVSLRSPLGQTLATIAVGPEWATLTPSGQPARSAPDVDALAASVLGWPLPVSGLRDWLQGCVRDERGVHVVARGAAEKATETITPDGWHIAYPDWQPVGATWRPRRIDVRRPADRTASEVALRIIIDTWQPRP